ncbi:hypothetical protein MKX75_16815 [Paenibacillus sp. FSL R5-0341]|uniref:hypothetical protein n=1 Tax=Paenibacillus sp. FSL R5-0341 TaxID=2921636 RepID=UPI0030CEB7CC
MTAEIGILNKTAVALAADSAVTITNRRGEKIYNYANKLFYLSKYHPIGIMVYGNAELSGVPWETIIKVYRKVLDGKVFDTTEEYAEDLFNFLQEEDNYLFGENTVNAGMENVILNFLRQISLELAQGLDVNFEGEEEVDPEDVLRFTDEFVMEKYEEISAQDYLNNFDHDDVAEILHQKEQLLDDIVEGLFLNLPLNNGNKDTLKMMTALYLCKDIFIQDYSGIVIAGFGELETFPSMYSYLVEGMVEKKLKYRYDKEKNVEISNENQGAVIPFAQDDMVYTILSGVDLEYDRFSKKFLAQVFDQYPRELISILKDNLQLDSEVSDKLLDSFTEISNQLFEAHKNETQKYLFNNHVYPIYNTIEILPKEELASIAETLVNITSFKRKISAAAETVGGPVDVALITKGDGFIWIKRKHYFDPSLNQHFFSNYFRRNLNDDLND